MRKLLFLLIVAATVGMMAGIVNAGSGVLDIPISGGDNDVEERQVDPADGEMDRGSSDLELGYDGADGQIIGLLFNDVQIPQGALITAAWVKLIAEQDEDDPVYTTIWGRLDDLGDSFTADVWSLSTPGVDDETAATVEWTLVDPDTIWPSAGYEVFTPDISSIIQEIVDQGTWTPGRNLVIAIGNENSEGVTQPDDQRRAESYNEDPAKAAVLHVEYSTGVRLVAPVGWAYVDLALLEWKRPEPNSPSESVLPVNVTFGTDENLDPGHVDTLEIETNADIDSTSAFPALDEETDYYWRVDLIDPNDGIPSIIPGDIWHFVTTIPAELNVTETDGTTEPGERDPTVNADEIILSLSRDPGAGVEVEVTITEVQKYNPLTNTKETVEAGVGDDSAKLIIGYDGTGSVEKLIATENDDMEQDVAGGGNDMGSSDLEFFDDGGDQIIGLRFTGINIPQGATIDSASVEFIIDETENDGEVYGFITGEKVIDAPLLENINFHLRDRLAANPTAATSSFTWTETYAIGDSLPTPDIASIIQEIVNQAGWTSGSSIVLFFTEDMNPDPLDLESVATYVLDSSNWETGVTVTITAVDDDVLEVDPEETTLTVTTSSTDSEWDGLSVADVTVFVLENECGAWGFDPLDLNTDCVIDIADLALFASQFEMCSDPQYRVLCEDVR